MINLFVAIRVFHSEKQIDFAWKDIHEMVLTAMDLPLYQLTCLQIVLLVWKRLNPIIYEKNSTNTSRDDCNILLSDVILLFDDERFLFNTYIVWWLYRNAFFFFFIQTHENICLHLWSGLQ